ncbi:MAG TPA: superoxide dismutase family protein [Planctomycetota bacterium]
MSTRLTSLAVLAACGLSACVFVHATDSSAGDSKHAHGSGSGQRASARIEARSGSSLSGTATFSEQKGGVLVEVSVTNAPPGWHAVHVHEKGDCSAADGSSAGSHFNPAGHKHGSPHASEHHAGDLGNMWVDEKGSGHHVLLMPALAVADGPNSVRGRSIIVHAAADDLVTDPTGNAGGRIGCGVIR